MTLRELIDACMEIVNSHNSDPNVNLEGLWFFELAPNIDKEDLSISRWRASLIKGRSPIRYSVMSNYFGETPDEAVKNLYKAISK